MIPKKQNSVVMTANNEDLTTTTNSIATSKDFTDSQSLTDVLAALKKKSWDEDVYNMEEEDLIRKDIKKIKRVKAGASEDDKKKAEKVLTPQAIKEYLDQYVVGQDHAKKVLAVAAFNHQRRTLYNLESKKSNILLVGPSGSGKTYLIQKLGELLKLPIAYADATTLTEAGYVGEDVDSILAKLFHSSSCHLPLAEAGIVFIDEFDKIHRKLSNNSSLDVSGVGVQQALLKMLEGEVIDVKLDHNRTHSVMINTQNILFICAGAFVGIEKIIKARLHPNKRRIGFSDESLSETEPENDFNKLLPQVNSDDIINFGFIPEIIGRIPLIAGLEKLREDDLVNILSNSKDNLVDEFKSNFDYGNNKLDVIFTLQSIREIARIAIKREIGARGLRSIFENIFLDAMFEAPSFSRAKNKTSDIKAIIVNQDSVKNNAGLTYVTETIDSEEFIDEESDTFKDLIANYKYDINNPGKKSTAKKATKTTKSKTKTKTTKTTKE